MVLTQFIRSSYIRLLRSRSMRGVNNVILIGNATRDAELRHTQNGKSVSSIRLATNRSTKGEEEAQFHTVVCWDRLAETTAEYVKKGDPLYVEGRLQYRAYRTRKARNAVWPRSWPRTCSSSAAAATETGVSPRPSPPPLYAPTRTSTRLAAATGRRGSVSGR